MRQIFYIETEAIFKRACELRGFGDRGDISWREWYEFETNRTRMTSGEVEQAVWEALNIPAPARHGFAVTMIDEDAVILTDLEENGNCDLSDPDDAHLVIPVTQFREWLYNWNKDPLNRVMDTTEAAAIWGLSQQRVKVLCLEGKIKARKMKKEWIIDRNQPSPKMTNRIKRKFKFMFEDFQGTLTLGEDGVYDFEWSGLEATLTFKSDEDRDEFLKDSHRISKVVDEIAHNQQDE